MVIPSIGYSFKSWISLILVLNFDTAGNGQENLPRTECPTGIKETLNNKLYSGYMLSL